MAKRDDELTRSALDAMEAVEEELTRADHDWHVVHAHASRLFSASRQGVVASLGEEITVDKLEGTIRAMLSAVSEAERWRVLRAVIRHYGGWGVSGPVPPA